MLLFGPYVIELILIHFVCLCWYSAARRNVFSNPRSVISCTTLEILMYDLVHSNYGICSFFEKPCTGCHPKSDAIKIILLLWFKCLSVMLANPKSAYTWSSSIFNNVLASKSIDRSVKNGLTSIRIISIQGVWKKRQPHHFAKRRLQTDQGLMEIVQRLTTYVQWSILEQETPKTNCLDLLVILEHVIARVYTVSQKKCNNQYSWIIVRSVLNNKRLISLWDVNH